MQAGDEIIMYGVLVGKAQNFIPRGGVMNTENTRHAADPFEYRPYHYKWTPRMFQNLKAGPLMVITVKMGELERLIIGCLCLLYFVKTVTWT
ncbi:hypothetical protein [Niabella hibiscisoli]|uniref:hypothetical protein n=1 Tax=Niabella hibiscisoli TaxID=1825928 RepID=UPI00293F30AA|nr:hypothetical protein [Niabella hibiscisoli]